MEGTSTGRGRPARKNPPVREQTHLRLKLIAIKRRPLAFWTIWRGELVGNVPLVRSICALGRVHRFSMFSQVSKTRHTPRARPKTIALVVYCTSTRRGGASTTYEYTHQRNRLVSGLRGAVAPPLSCGTSRTCLNSKGPYYADSKRTAEAGRAPPRRCFDRWHMGAHGAPTHR